MEASRWSACLFGLIAVVYFGMPSADGCMCERWHPQQHFCASEYVIGGHVVKREFVRVNQGDSPGLIAGPPPAQLAPGLGIGGIEPLPEQLQPYEPQGGLHSLPDEPGPFEGETEPFYHPRDTQPGGLQPLPQPAGLQPLPHPEAVDPLPLGRDLEALPHPNAPPMHAGGLLPAQTGPDGIKPLPHPEGLEPLPEGLQPEELPPLPLPEETASNESSSTNAPVAPTEAIPEATTSDLKTSSNETAMGTTPDTQEDITTDEAPFDPSKVDPWNYKIVYTLKLVHIYKTGKEEAGWTEGSEVQLSTPAADSQCGQTTLKMDRTYLISGHRSGRISLCDWVQEHHRLTARQKQGLKLVYGRQCDTCHIKACPSSRHCNKPKNNRATTCLYNASQVRLGNAYSPYDCLASHSRCTMRHGNRCKWQKNNDYHDCVKHQLP